MKSIFGRSPSATFCASVEAAVASYEWDCKHIEQVKPSLVRKRLTALKEELDAVLESIENLPDSDAQLVSGAATVEFLAERPCAYERKAENVISLYRSHVQSALERLNAFKQTGRMPGFAKQIFAVAIAEAYQLETGERPTATRAHTKRGEIDIVAANGEPGLRQVSMRTPGSKFYRVLKFLLDQRDVEPLVRHAVKFLGDRH